MDKAGRKTGGRKKGTPNKVNRDRREKLAQFLDENYDEFIGCWKLIDDPYKKCSIYTSLISFATPKLQSIELNNQTGQKSFEEELDELENKTKNNT